MEYSPLNLERKFNQFADFWSPKTIARLNDYHIKLVRLKGDFVWHRHPDTDEFFLVVEGAMRIDFRDGSVELAAGEMYVVPRGIEHKPFAAQECRVLLIEPAGTPNTGDAGGERTTPADDWI